MNNFEVTEVIDILSKREEFMEALTEGEKTRQELVESLDVSRRTVYRALDKLEERGLVKSSDDEYELTVYGRMAFQDYNNLQRRLSNMYESQKLLSSIPSEKNIDTLFLKDADITISENGDVNNLLDIIEEKIEEAEKIRVFASKIPGERYIDIFYKEIVEEGTDAELIIDRNFIQYLVFDYLSTSQNALECDNLEVLRTNEDLPFGMAITENEDGMEAGIGIWNPEGDVSDVSGLIWNDNNDAVDWAESTYEEYRKDSELIDPNQMRG